MGALEFKHSDDGGDEEFGKFDINIEVLDNGYLLTIDDYDVRLVYTDYKDLLEKLKEYL